MGGPVNFNDSYKPNLAFLTLDSDFWGLETPDLIQTWDSGLSNKYTEWGQPLMKRHLYQEVDKEFRPLQFRFCKLLQM